GVGHSAAKLLRAKLRGRSPGAQTTLRESVHLRCKVYCESGGTTSKKLRTHSKSRAEAFSWYQFGEAYSALRGRRPIPAALPSHSVLLVPGPKIILPTQRFQNIRNRPTQVSNIPDKQQSIRKTACSVKCELFSAGGESGLSPYLPGLPAAPSLRWN